MDGIVIMLKTNSDSFLFLEDVYVRYINSQNRAVTILNDIDLKINQGEFITIVGPSGCGKSTLLRLILGSEPPTQGKIIFEGKPINSPNRNRGIVFQKYSLFPHLTILENLMFGLDVEQYSLSSRFFSFRKYKKDNQKFRAQAQEYLDRVGLSQDGNKYPQQLSGGMRQRAAIVQSLIMRPKILLMDEPFGALDDSIRQDMQLFILEQWKKYKMTIFFVTHDLEEAIFLGSRTLVLSQYYSTDLERNEGAKIVTDIEIPGAYPRTSKFKYTDTMSQLVRKIRKDGLDPEHRQHIKDFDLSHQNAFRTINKNERR